MLGIDHRRCRPLGCQLQRRDEIAVISYDEVVGFAESRLHGGDRAKPPVYGHDG